MKVKNKFARIFLVRHGEVTNRKNIIYGYLPVPLSPKGKIQALKAGIFLKKKNIAAIFTSPQKRSQETAKIIKKAIGGKIKIITDKNLRESGFGFFTQGLTRLEAVKKYPKQCLIYNREPAKLKAGESLAEQVGRMLSVINNEIKKYPGRNLVFVSHRDPILAALLKISKRSFNDLHEVKYLCETGSVLEIDLIGRRLVNKNF
jgi:probable phosphoglycerate mutase